MKLSEIMKDAMNALNGKWDKAICITLAYLLVSIISFIIPLIGIIVLPPLGFGLSTAFLKLKRNEEVKIFDFVNIGINNFSRAWKITGRVILKLLPHYILTLLLTGLEVTVLVYGVYPAMWIVSGIENIPEFVSNLILLGLVLGAFFCMLCLPIYLISKILLYSLTSYIANDSKEKSASEVVNKSARLMKGSRKKIALLYVVLLIVFALTFGIGILFLFPYIQMATICLYDKLIQPKTNEEAPAQESPIQDM